MPLVTLTVLHSTPAAHRQALLDAVHMALIAVGVPPADRFQRVLALPASALVFDPHYPEDPETQPNHRSQRNECFAIVEVLWSVGRSVKIKKQLLQQQSTTKPEQRLLRPPADPAQASISALICCNAAGSSIVVRSPTSRCSHTA